MEIVQHKQCIEADQNLEKKCKRKVHNSPQIDNGPSVNGPLYSGLKSWIFMERTLILLFKESLKAKL